MIRIARPKLVPGTLRTKGNIREQQHCAQFDANPAEFLSGAWTFLYDDAVYTAKPVKRRLVEIHHYKCCYCEKQFRKSEQLDVEHFRPKGAVQQSVGQNLEKPGYYWLVYRWENLLLSCRVCNRQYKKAFFPLADPMERAQPHLRNVEAEKPLFIDPASVDPRLHIRFEDDAPIGLTEEGRETILRIGLTRTNLRDDRLARLAQIKTSLDIISTAEALSGSANLQTDAEKAREFIESAVQSDAEFSSMAIDYLA